MRCRKPSHTAYCLTYQLASYILFINRGESLPTLPPRYPLLTRLKKQHTIKPMKNNQEKIEGRLTEIARLMRERDRINDELATLLGMAPNTLPTSLPDGFSLNDEIRKVFQEKGPKLRILEVKKELDKKHRVNLIRDNVQGAMQYMKSKGVLNKEKEYGVFSLNSQEGG